MKSNKFNTYLFDADGTLIDTRDMIIKCFLHTFDKFGKIDVEPREIEKLIGIPYRLQLEHFMGKLDDKLFSDIREDHIKHQYSIYKDSLKLCPGVMETLKELKRRNCKIGIVTSRTITTLGLFLDYFEIRDFFDIIVTPNETDKHKPDPEPVLYALEKLSSDAGDTIFIGDAIYDIQSGNKAGVSTCFTKWSPIDVSTIDANYFIDDMREVLYF